MSVRHYVEVIKTGLLEAFCIRLCCSCGGVCGVGVKVGEWWAGPGRGKARCRTNDLCHWSGGGLIAWLRLLVLCGVE